MKEIKPLLLALGLGLGLSGVMSAPAFAGPDRSMCIEYQEQCNQGDANACQKFDDKCWFRDL